MTTDSRRRKREKKESMSHSILILIQFLTTKRNSVTSVVSLSTVTVEESDETRIARLRSKVTHEDKETH